VRRRLVLAIGAVTAGSVVLFAIPLAIVLGRQLHDEALLRLQRDAIAATRAIDLPAQHGDPVEVPRSHDLLAVYGRSGRRIAGAGPAAPGRQVADALRTGRPSSAEAAQRLVVAVPVLSRERVIGALRASRSTAALDADVRDAWLIVTGLGLGVIAIAVLAALAVSRRLTRPVERLAGAAARLGEGDFSARAPRTGVPELDAVAATLDATAERLDDLLRRERAFTADASHQLRTPLAALRLELEAMELEAPSDEVERALEQIDRLEATIDTLLAVARDAPRDRAEIDLVGAVEAIEPDWRTRLAADGRPLRIHATREPLRARAAPAVVDQILDVLLDNAYRHGGGEVTVTVRETPRGAAIDIADRGPGLHGDPVAAFHRRASGANGHGIGLSLARSLAEAEGGALVVSNPGPHPKFTLLIGSGDVDRGSHPPLTEPIEHP
jgi:signal transduction histidine kinase